MYEECPSLTAVLDPRCEGGGVQFVLSSTAVFSTRHLTLCGDNERYSPPVVMFLDLTNHSHVSPVLLLGVDHSTSRTQFLAHFSFTSSSDKQTGLRMAGGTRVPNTGFWFLNIMLDRFLICRV